MKNNLVVTICIGKESEEIGKLTHLCIKKYAEKIDADFLVIDKQEVSQTTPHWEKFQFFNLLNKYDQIIYFDTDILIRDDCPNLFDVVPENLLGMFEESQFTDHSRYEAMFQTCKEYNVVLPEWKGEYYNSGVIVMSRKHKFLWKKPEYENCYFYEQSYLNMQIQMQKIDMFKLDYKFNHMVCMDKFTGMERHSSYVIHYAGCPNHQFLINMIKKDKEKWKQDAPEYRYKRHILIDVQGGLGDQVQAEPTIRFLKEKLHPNDDIRIITHWPRLFRDLGLPVYNHGYNPFPELDTQPFRKLTLGKPEQQPLWSFLQSLLCHTTDFISISVLKRILPDKDKRIKLSISLDEISSIVEVTGQIKLDEMILVHPGKHWENKTFPTEWWQTIIDGIHKEGIRVCVFGKDANDIDKFGHVVGDRGVIELQLREGMIDLRNLLELGGNIALISVAKVLITNDSAPVHLAGAFDNHIILIPSVKHPDHVLPYRNNGDKYYKACALYKKLPVDEIPTSPTIIQDYYADKFLGDPYDYLPDPEDVIKEAIKRFRNG